MLDFPQSMAMLAPSSLHTVDVVDDVDRKFNATHLYYQPHAVQIIQLVECSPPARILSPESFASSSGSSSSYCSEEESECSSYCSSVEPLAENSSPAFVHDEPSPLSETYNIRMKRILAWREDFSSHLSTTMSGESGTVLSWFEHEVHYFFRLIDPNIASSLKRKMPANSDDNDAVSRRSFCLYLRAWRVSRRYLIPPRDQGPIPLEMKGGPVAARSVLFRVPRVTPLLTPTKTFGSMGTTLALVPTRLASSLSITPLNNFSSRLCSCSLSSRFRCTSRSRAPQLPVFCIS